MDTSWPHVNLTQFPHMASLADIVVYSTVGAILSVAIVTGMCAVYIALSRTQAHAQKLTCNKYVVPGFPCDGTLMMMAKDGVIYVVPEGKAVVNATRLFTKCTVVVFLEVVTGTEGSLTMKATTTMTNTTPKMKKKVTRTPLTTCSAIGLLPKARGRRTARLPRAVVQV